MAGQTNDEKNKYAHLDRLSTEALEELLGADIESPDDDDDNDEAIFHILEVIEQREKEHPTGRLSDVDKAWADFQKHYNTEEGEGLSLYPGDEPENQTSDIHIVHEAAVPRVKVNRIRRTLIVAAVVACLVVFAMPPALGYQNFIQMIGQWTESVFHFGPGAMPSAPSGEQAPLREHAGEYETLQEALDDFGITERVAPTYITDGFIAISITGSEAPEFDRLDVNAFYENSAGKAISISITKRAASGSYNYEKDDSSVTPYTVEDVTHYIFDNNGRTISTWFIGTLECSITADISLAETERIIDSIYER